MENKDPEALLDLDAFFQTQSQALILDITKAISRKLDDLTERQKNLRTELSTTRYQHQQIKDQIETMRKQLLYKFNTSVPLLAGPSIRTVWNLETLTLAEYDPEFVELTGYTTELLISKSFNLNQLFPKFFQPFAIEFIHRLRENMAVAGAKMSQRVFLLTGNGEEIPVQFDCESLAAAHPGFIVIQSNRLAFS